MKKAFFMLAALVGFTYMNESVAQKIQYPNTKKVEQTDNYHGTSVQDPYRWLENDTSAETKAWVKQENEVTQAYLEKIPYRAAFKKRLEELSNYPKYSSPFRAGEYYFFSKNDGLQNQSVYYVQKGLDGAPQVFLDPNKMSEKGTVSVGFAGFSKDYKYVAYNVSSAGSDWSEMHFKEVATGKELPDVLKYVKFSGASFTKEGFYYSRYPEPKKGTELSGQNQFHSVYFHKLGDPQENDELIYEDKENPLRYHSAGVTEDLHFLVLSKSQGTDGNETWVQDLAKKETEFKPIVKGFNTTSSIVDNEGDLVMLYTNADAPNYKLVLVDPNNPDSKNWKTIIPEKGELLQGVTTAGDYLIATYLKNVSTKVYQLKRDGSLVREIILPSLGGAGGFGGEREDKFVFYSFTSFTYPPSIFKYDLATGKSEIFRKSEAKFNPEDYEAKQVFVPSKDGTKVPIFIVHKKGLVLDGKRPTLLYAYGGFNINLEAGFSAFRLALLENDGVYVQANLRGGGEFGETWHRAGMKEKKQNVFDDFIACAEWLQANKYTSKEHLGIQGGSNGGLLIGAVMTQRPDLFKVCFPAVGVLDMLRFQKFTVGWGWVDEYGSSDNALDFPYLYKYSPLHNIKPAAYPATMVLTADHDDRVVPAHSFKFISTLQAAQQGENPVLIRIETDAGHGAGTALSKAIVQTADVYSFLFFNTKSPVKY